METAFHTTQVVLPVLYTLLVVGYARLFTRGPEGVGRVVRPVLVGTLILHFGSIGLRSTLLGACPLGTPSEFLTLMAFSMALTYLLLELRLGERSTGVFALSPAFLLQLVATVSMLGSEGAPRAPMGLRASLHSFAAVVGFAAVTICTVYGILYLSLYASIKKGAFGLFFRKMPSLETLSGLNVAATLLAFLALTVMIGVGAWGAAAPGESTVTLDVLEVGLTTLIWVLYAGALAGWRFFHLGGKRVALTTVVGFVLLLGVFAGVLIDRGFHT